MTGFNISDESYIDESILFRFHGSTDDATVINNCIQHTNHYIYLEKKA